MVEINEGFFFRVDLYLIFVVWILFFESVLLLCVIVFFGDILLYLESVIVSVIVINVFFIVLFLICCVGIWLNEVFISVIIFF